MYCLKEGLYFYKPSIEESYVYAALLTSVPWESLWIAGIWVKVLLCLGSPIPTTGKGSYDAACMGCGLVCAIAMANLCRTRLAPCVACNHNVEIEDTRACMIATILLRLSVAGLDAFYSYLPKLSTSSSFIYVRPPMMSS